MKAETIRAQVAVHCRWSNKKVSAVDSKNELEIICHRDELMKSQATHVVVAITYGLEAFCVFSHQQQKKKMPKTKIGDEAAAERMRNYARLYLPIGF